MSHAAFDLLCGPIQEVLVRRMGWTELRPIQVDAIKVVLQSDVDLIIAAATASGKTEAAFLPVLSRLFECRRQCVQAIYVGPLKALINDQFRRLDELCQLAHIPVHRWHGDVTASQKRRLLERPSGVLLITPESLESVFINRTFSLSNLFNGLQFVVIDELHAFVGRERGTHLRSLLFRLKQYAESSFRIISLSATLGSDVDPYKKWMRPENPAQVRLISDPGESKSVHYKIYGYLQAARQDAEDDPNDVDVPPLEDEPIIADMVAAFAGSTNLIFANAKSKVEQFADALNERCRRSGRVAEFLVHHGSLSREIREQTETLMRKDWPFTAVCSSTLELGIDIGNVTAVGQIGAPWSVNSLLQRLGRSGRRDGQAQVMRVYIEQWALPPDASLVHRLRPELLQAIALTELVLEKPRWLEPPRFDDLDLSTLLHQVLSVIAETGGSTAQALYSALVVRGAFRWSDQSTFLSVLRSMGSRDLIEQAPDGTLILGLRGEAIVRHYDFYTAFQTPVEYAVIHDGRLIGQLPATAIPRVGQSFLLGARRWKVLSVDEHRRDILVERSRGRKSPNFTSGFGEVHAKVRRKMREIVVGSSEIPYLNQQASEWLAESRHAAKCAGLCSQDLFEDANGGCVWFTWTGSRAQNALMLMMSLRGLAPEDLSIAISYRESPGQVLDCLRGLLKELPTSIELAAAMPVKLLRKFDEYLDDELLVRSLAASAIDVPEAARVAHKLA